MNLGLNTLHYPPTNLSSSLWHAIYQAVEKLFPGKKIDSWTLVQGDDALDPNSFQIFDGSNIFVTEGRIRYEDGEVEINELRS